MGCSSSKEAHPADQPGMAQVPPGPGRLTKAPQAQQAELRPSPNNSPVIQRGTGQWPKIIDLGFTVYIYSHEVVFPPQNVPCWTYVSQGISRNKQPEIVFTIRRRPNEHEENFPLVPLEWMKLVNSLAGSGLNLQTGQMCDLIFQDNNCLVKLNNMIIPQPSDQWTSLRRFGGIVHGISIASALTGVPPEVLPGDCHHVIALTQEEAVVAREFGVTRAVGHVGLAVRWFPHPPFVDRDREDTVTMGDMAGSMRTQFPIARIFGFNASVIDDDIILTIPVGDETRDAFINLVKQTPETAALAFESFINAEMDGGFVWKTGQTVPMAYMSNCGQSRRLNLGYICFAANDAEDTFSNVEDGYAILLRVPTWRSVRNAIQNKQDIVIPLQRGTNHMRFCLEWKKTIYHNPVDGSEVHAVWKEYKPSGPPSNKLPTFPHIKMSQTIFLAEPPPGHCNVDELVAYVQRILEILAEGIPVTPVPMLGRADVGRRAIVEFEIPKCEGWLKFSMTPSVEGLNPGEILPKIAQLVQPRTISTIKMQCFYDIWGYQGPTARFS